jgi:L-aspartate oxidase
MWDFAGIARNARGLRTAVGKLGEIGSRLPPGATEELNMLQTAELIVEAALLRQESRGGHYRADYPRAKPTWKGRHIEL